MKVLCLALALVANPQTAGEHANLVALFEQGATFPQFLARVTSQRDVWLTNAARTDISPAEVERLARVRRGLRLLVVAEDWCPDSVHTVPYLANLASAAGVEMRIVDRAAGDALMARHRTRDGRKVTPTVVLLEDDRDAGAWVERPAVLQALFFSMATNGESARRFADRSAWYDADRGRTTIAEVLALVERTAGRQ
jgi:hypothetical protein